MANESPRQKLINIIMQGDDDEVQLEFLQSSTLEELRLIADNIQSDDDDDVQ